MYLRFPTLQKVTCVAMETNRLSISAAVQHVVDEQRDAEDGCVGLQPGAVAQTAQTKLQKQKFNVLQSKLLTPRYVSVSEVKFRVYDGRTRTLAVNSWRRSPLISPNAKRKV